MKNQIPVNAYYAFKINIDVDQFGDKKYIVEKLASIGQNEILDEFIEKGHLEDFQPPSPEVIDKYGYYYGSLVYRIGQRKYCLLRLEFCAAMGDIGLMYPSVHQNDCMLIVQKSSEIFEVYVINGTEKEDFLLVLDYNKHENVSLLKVVNVDTYTNFVLMSDTELAEYLNSKKIAETVM